MEDDLGPFACHCTAARRLARYASRIYERHLAPSGTTTTQFSILNHLRDSPQSTAELANILAMDRTTLVRALHPLLSTGLVASGMADKSSRQKVFSITERGLRKVAETAPLWSAAQLEYEQHLGTLHARGLRQEFLELTVQP